MTKETLKKGDLIIHLYHSVMGIGFVLSDEDKNVYKAEVFWTETETKGKNWSFASSLVQKVYRKGELIKYAGNT